MRTIGSASRREAHGYNGAVALRTPEGDCAHNGRSDGAWGQGARVEELRVLFFSEGDLGTHVLGHDRHNEAARVGLGAWPAGGVLNVQGHFATLTPLSGVSNAIASHRVEPFAAANLDFRTLRWHGVQALRARRQLARAMREWPADWVHIHSHSIGLAMGTMMRTQPIALSVDATVRDWWEMPAWRSPQTHAPFMIAPSQALERRAFAKAGVVLACTPWARRAVEREAPSAHVLVHHPGIDLERYLPATRRERTTSRILFIGGRFQEKGGEDLLAALVDVLGRTAELDIVTPAQVAERPGVRVHRLRAGEPALIDLLQQADVMCLPTYADSNPWTILEAMACGTPVIASTVGGIAEMLDGGRAGVLTPPGDRRALREALLGLLANAERRAQIAAQARANCEIDHDARRQFGRLIGHLRDAGDMRRQLGGAPANASAPPVAGRWARGRPTK